MSDLPSGLGPTWPAADPDPASILVVDDRDGNLVAMQALLETLGRRVVVARSGTEALRRLLVEPFAVILLDVQMPEMNGFETARYIRTRPATRTIPIIFITAISTASEHVFQGYEEGAVDYIMKPVDGTILLSKVAVFVELYETNAKLRRHAGLQAMQDTLSLAQRGGDSGIWDVAVGRGEVYWSPEYADLTGLGDPPGDPAAWLATVDPRDRARIDTRLARVLEHDEPWNEEFRVSHPIRGMRWIASRGRVFRSATGGPERLTGIAFDVTERKLADDRMDLLQEATATLSSRVTVAEVTDPVADFARRIAGADDVDLVGRAESGALVYADDRGRMTGAGLEERVEALVRGAMRSGRPQADGAGPEPMLALPLPTTNGPARVLLLAGRPGQEPPVVSSELLTFQSVAAQALERAHLYEMEHDGRIRQELLAEVSAALDGEVEMRARLDALAAALVPRLADVCIVELDPGHRAERGGAAARRDLEPYLTLPLPPVHGAPRGEAAGTGRPPPPWTELALPDPSAHLVVPLRARHAKIGALWLLAFTPGRRYTAADGRLAEEIGRRAGLAVDNARLYELQEFVATTLQRSLLPATLPGTAEIAIAARYMSAAPHAEAGGDWFEAVELDDGRVMLAVGDVVGRGTEAAAAMGQLRSAARAYSLQSLGPREIVRKLNRFAVDVPGAAVSTVVCAEIHAARERVVYVCAGHPPPLVVNANGRATYLEDGRGPPLGLGDYDYEEGAVPFTTGDRLVMYSDGAVERRDEPIDHGLDRLARTASANANGDEEAIADAILSRVDHSPSSTDDVALLVAGYRPAPEALHITFPAEPPELVAVRHELRAWLARARIEGTQREDVLLCAMEACANAVEHAYADAPAASVAIDVGLHDADVVITVRDGGEWRREPAPGERGHGIAIMRQLMDAVDIDAGAGGTTLRMSVTARYATCDVELTPNDRPPGRLEPGRAATLEMVSKGADVRAAVRGDLDDEAVAIARERLATHVDVAQRVLLDLTGVTFLGSRAIGWLIECGKRMRRRGAALCVISPPNSVSRRVLRLCGIGVGPGDDPDALPVAVLTHAEAGSEEFGAGGLAPDGATEIGTAPSG